ncbi:MAG TPA: BACON domain-containing protein [Blastocatellia bacterium]|nr:BACON domain-containing protein [Blastocatellia bacterium]
MNRLLRTYVIFALALIGSFALPALATAALPAATAQTQEQMQPPELASAVTAVKFARRYMVVGPPGLEIQVLYYYTASDSEDRIQLTSAPDTFQLNESGFAYFSADAVYPAPLSAAGDSLCSVFLDADGKEITSPLCTPVSQGDPGGAANYALSYAIVSGEFSGAPNTQYDLSFFFTPAGSDCAAGTPQLLTASPMPVETDENGRISFSVPLATPMSGGLINCKATGPDGAASQFSGCVPVMAPSCPPSISPALEHVSVEGGGGTVNAVALLTCSDVTATSNADWIHVMSVTPPSASAPHTAITYSVEPNADADERIGTINVGGQTFTVRQAGTRPVMKLTGMEKKGKKLMVFGENFDSGAKVMINGLEQKTRFEDATRLTAPKAGKKIKRGDRVHVVNSDGARSASLIY